jgi:protein-tyrosine phosphatase
MAEAILRHKSFEKKIAIVVDSAGTANYHIGDKPDYRTLKILNEYGIQTNHRARQINYKDLETFDLILAMDNQNLEHLYRMCQKNKSVIEKIRLAGDFHPKIKGIEVPDPYYGNLNDFRTVFNLLDDICTNLLNTNH